MNYQKIKFITAFVLIVFFGFQSPEANGKVIGGKVLYRVNLKSDAAKSISVKQNPKDLEINLEGFGQTAALKANDGGVEMCRTIIEHKSEKATIILSLPIPTPNAPCQMTEGFVSINSQTYKISLTEETIKKSVGNDGQLRKLVEKYFGEVQGE